MLIARGEHGRVIAERGTILFDGPWGTREVPIASSSDPGRVAGSQFVLVTVKSQDTECGRERRCATLGRCRRSFRFRTASTTTGSPTYVEPQRLVMGMTATNMALVEPGRVSLQLGGATIFGPPVGGKRADQHADVRARSPCLNRIRWPSLRFAGPSKRAWESATTNWRSTRSGTRRACRRRISSPRRWPTAAGGMRWVCRSCGSAAACSTGPGSRSQRIPGVPNLPKLERLMRLMNAPVVGPAIAFGARRLFNRRPIVFSLLQDLQRRKPTEVDYVNGEIVRLAESVGTSAPANALGGPTGAGAGAAWRRNILRPRRSDPAICRVSLR